MQNQLTSIVASFNCDEAQNEEYLLLKLQDLVAILRPQPTEEKSYRIDQFIFF